MIKTLLKNISETGTNDTFDKVAWALLNQYVIIIKGKQFRLREIEFYLHSPLHLDEDSHCHERQGMFGLWYFHRFKNPEKYYNQKMKGIDLTFGNKEVSIYGGILMRAIEDIEKGEVIYGPTKLTNRIMENLSIGELIELATNTQAVFNHNIMPFQEETLVELPVFKAERIGLGKKENQYKKAFYRYFTYPRMEYVAKK